MSDHEENALSNDPCSLEAKYRQELGNQKCMSFCFGLGRHQEEVERILWLISKAHLTILLSWILPSLQHLVTVLPRKLVDASTLETDTAVSRLKISMQFLSRLEIALRRLNCSLSLVHPGIMPSDAAQDELFEKLKSFVSCRFAIKIHDALIGLCRLLQASIKFIVALGQSLDDEQQIKSQLLLRVTCFCDSIDVAINVMNQPEFNIQDEWQACICLIDHSPERLIQRVVCRRNNSEPEEGEEENDRIVNQLTRPDNPPNIQDQDGRSETSQISIRSPHHLEIS